LPKDAKFIGVNYSAIEDSFWLCFESESFDEVPFDSEPPVKTILLQNHGPRNRVKILDKWRSFEWLTIEEYMEIQDMHILPPIQVYLELTIGITVHYELTDYIKEKDIHSIKRIKLDHCKV
jgi:hypothetical protein